MSQRGLPTSRTSTPTSMPPRTRPALGGRDLAPKLFQTLTNMIDYGGQFGSYYPKLRKAAEHVDDPHYRDQFIGGFDRLTKKITGFEA